MHLDWLIPDPGNNNKDHSPQVGEDQQQNQPFCLFLDSIFNVFITQLGCLPTTGTNEKIGNYENVPDDHKQHRHLN